MSKAPSFKPEGLSSLPVSLGLSWSRWFVASEKKHSTHTLSLRLCTCIHYIAYALSHTDVHTHTYTHTHTCTVLPLTSGSASRARIIEYALCPYFSRKMLREGFALASFTVKIRASSHACASSSGTRCSYVLPVCVCVCRERERVCVCLRLIVGYTVLKRLARVCICIHVERESVCVHIYIEIY